ncbi:hypothetical protein FRC10_012147 [Ceratobasidium sp. 414]|nr:hypothetical protein FRC10_012147 [Ceratobasidium sp. 414]
MEAEQENMPEVTLSGFRFENQPGRSPGEHQGATEHTLPGNPAGADIKRSEAFERMATDKLGQELAHDATIWKLYLEEADDHDQELVKGRHASLDMLLLFAALFSAILTAFLIESKDLLQQDPADVSTALLLSIAQSQYRVEQGLPLPSNASSLPSVPDFTPSISARWINGIWFASLSLSLSAALIAMLGKEWLTAFLASRPRPAHSHALLRQSRLEGLERWWALHIIALLPSLLHASLLLFAIGLVIYLWTIDTIVAAVIAAVVAITSLFYIITAVLGAVYDYCPFVTEISGYVRRAIMALLRRDRTDKYMPSKYPSLKDLQALLWLANNARDPAVVDCCYQALAGLQHTTGVDMDHTVVLPESGANPSHAPTHGIPMQLNEDTTLVSLLDTITGRYKQLVAGSLDVFGSPDMSAARYLRAILGISTHISHFSDPQLNKSIGTRNHANILPGLVNKGDMLVGVGAGSKLSPLQLLDMTEALWGDQSPPLSANTYASVLILAMDIVQFAISSDSERKYQNGAHVIDVTTGSTQEGLDIYTLRAYYSRWLARVSSLLRLYSGRQVLINPVLLDGLLGSVTTAARCDALNPLDSSSTHHPQVENLKRPFKFILSTNAGRSFSIESNDLGTGPLGSLLELLSLYPAVKDGSPIQTCMAALTAYSALAPVLLQQILGLDRDELRKAYDIASWKYAHASDMMGIRFMATRQALLTTRYLGLSRTLSSNHFRFLEDVTELVYICIQQENKTFRKDTFWALVNHSADLVHLLEFVGENDSVFTLLTENTKFNLLDVAGLGCHGVAPCENLLTPNCFPPLIRMIRHSSHSVAGVERLPQAMVRRMRAGQTTIQRQDIPWNNIPAIEYIYPFTRTSKGFSALASAGTEERYAEVVVKAIVDIVHLAAGQDASLAVKPIELRFPAVPGFLDVMSTVVACCAKLMGYDALLMQYSNDAIDLMKAAAKDDASKELLRQHSACQDLWKMLKGLNQKDSMLGLLAKFRDAQAELGISLEG